MAGMLPSWNTCRLTHCKEKIVGERAGFIILISDPMISGEDQAASRRGLESSVARALVLIKLKLRISLKYSLQLTTSCSEECQYVILSLLFFPSFLLPCYLLLYFYFFSLSVSFVSSVSMLKLLNWRKMRPVVLRSAFTCLMGSLFGLCATYYENTLCSSVLISLRSSSTQLV